MEAWRTIPDDEAIPTEGSINWGPTYREAINRLGYHVAPMFFRAEEMANAPVAQRRVMAGQEAVGFGGPMMFAGPRAVHLKSVDAYLNLKRKSLGGKLTPSEETMFRKEYDGMMEKMGNAPKTPMAEPGKAGAAPTSSLDIFQAMSDIKASSAQGNLVYLPDLYRNLMSRGVPKSEIDAEIRKLAESEIVQLQATSAPKLGAGWHPVEDEKLFLPIEYGKGETRYIMAIGKRMQGK